MKNTMIKKTGLRTAGKAFGIIDIILGCLVILGCAALFACSIIITQKIAGQPTTEPEVIRWQEFADQLWTYGIVTAVAGPLMLAFAIVGFKLVQKSTSFTAMLVIGIANIVVGGAPILGILMIIIAYSECHKATHKK